MGLKSEGLCMGKFCLVMDAPNGVYMTRNEVDPNLRVVLAGGGSDTNRATLTSFIMSCASLT